MAVKYSEVNVLTMSEENPVYRKFLKQKDILIEEQKQKMQKSAQKMRQREIRRAKRKGDKISPIVPDVNPDFDFEKLEEYLFLCFATKKYFKDSMIVSVIKFILGIASIIVAVLLEKVNRLRRIPKAIMIIALFGYGIIMTPLSVLYFFANLFCYSRASDFVSTRDSKLSKKIINFYDPETNKLTEVNWKNIFSNSKSSYEERRRIRGW